MIDDTDFRGFSHNEEGFYIYLGKVNREEELKSYLEDISIVLYRTEKHYAQLDIKIRDLEQELENIQHKESLMPHSRMQGSDQLIRELKEWQDAKQWMSRMYIGFIISPSINRTSFMREAKQLLSQQQRFELVVDKDSAIQFDSVRVTLSVLTKSS